MDASEKKETIEPTSEGQPNIEENPDAPLENPEHDPENAPNNSSTDSDEAISTPLAEETDETEEADEIEEGEDGEESEDGAENVQTIENQTEVKKQVNVQKNEGDVLSSGRDIYQYDSVTVINQEKSAEKYEAVDPSKPLDFEPKIPIGLFDAKLREGIAHNRVFYIVCPDDLLALEAAWSLYNKIKLDVDSLESRIISPADSDEEKQSRNITSLLQSKRSRISKLSDAFLVVDLRDNVFLDSTLEMSISLANGIITALKNNTSYLAILVHREAHIQSVLSENHRFYSWQVDFVEALLSIHDLKEQVEEVKKQKQQGLWGKTDAAFCRAINIYSKESSDRLLREIEKRAEYDGKQNIEEFKRSNIEKETTKEIIKASPLSRYVCFIVTYFPQISLTNLRRLLHIIVQEEPPVQELYTYVSKKGKKKEKWVEVSLWDIWNDEEKGGDNVLFDSSIKVYENDGDQKDYYSFSEPYLLESFKDFFERGRGRRFLQKCFKKIWGSGIFFDEITRDDFLLDLATLSTKMAVKDKEEFGIKVLLNILGEVHYFEDKEHSEELTLNKLFAGLKKYHILNRMCFLMSEMIKHNKLKEDVYSTLSHQIAISRHEVVFDVIKRLHYSPDFDSLMWLKRLIDNGKRAVKRKAYQYLIENVIENPEQIDYYLNTIHAWQEAIKDNERYSLSAYSSLLFIVDYSLRLEVDDHGAFPTSYLLLANSNEEALDDFSVKIIEWIFHPNMKAAIDEIRELFKQDPISTIIVYSDILEYWYKIICGQSTANGTNQEKLFHLVLEEVLNHCNTNRREDIVIAFNSKLKFIELKIAAIRRIIPPRNQIKLKDKVINAWKERHKNVNQLKDKFKKTAF